MTKAASVSLGLAVLFAAATITRAQTASSDIETASQEAVRREANTILLRQKLADAQVAEARKDISGAAKLYTEAVSLVQDIGRSNVEPEATRAVAGLISTRMALARAAESAGDLREANTQISQALKAAPNNEQVVAYHKSIQQKMKDQEGTVPSEQAMASVPGIQKQKTAASTLVQNGRLYLEMGQLDEAEANLKKAIETDPENKEAYEVLTQVKEARLKQGDRKRDEITKSSLVDVGPAWEPSTSRRELPIPNPYASDTRIYTSQGRQRIVSKLNQIRLDNVFFDGLPLGEVIKVLSDEAKKRDPDKKGINFIINPNAPAPVIQAAPITDPNTGLQLPPAPVEAVDVSGISIKLNPALTDVRLADVLAAIVQVADHPIKYSIEDYGIVFSLKGEEPTPLYTRTFRVDPNTFYQGLEAVSGLSFGNIATTSGTGGTGGGGNVGGGGGVGGGTSSGQGGGLTIPYVNVSGVTIQNGTGGGAQGGGQQPGQDLTTAQQPQGGGLVQGPGLRFVTREYTTDQVSAAVRNFFTSLGVNLDPALNKSVFFNDRLGLLVVRATQQDLDTIEQAIQVLNVAPPQINIKARFAQVAQNNIKELGFQWFLGNVVFGGDSTAVSGGTQPSYNGSPSTANPQGFFPGTSAGTAIASAATDQLITGGLRNGGGPNNLPVAPAIASLTGILTDPQFRMVINALEQQDNVDLLTAPQVNTLSGRQAQVQVVELRTIVTSTSFNTGGQAGGAATTTTTGGGTTALPNQPVFNVPGTQIIPLGPTLDVVPYVCADGYTIQMTIIPTVTEFLGYDDPGAFVPTAITGGGIPIASVLPLPHFRVRQVTTSAIVWDGQTVVLGGLITEDVAKIRDKVPFLGDIPLLGRLFRSESTSVSKKNLLIFVTPTIIDPAGNPKHSPDEMPFAQSGIPHQVNATPITN